MSRMLKLRRRLLNFDICIDNGALDDFLDCFQRIRCAETFCEDCRHCHRYAQRAIRFDRKEAEVLATDIDKFLEDFLTLGSAAQ
jgi:hypothetical protein